LQKNPNAGRWTLDAGRWTLDAGRWTLDAGRWTLDDFWLLPSPVKRSARLARLRIHPQVTWNWHIRFALGAWATAFYEQIHLVDVSQHLRDRHIQAFGYFVTDFTVSVQSPGQRRCLHLRDVVFFGDFTDFHRHFVTAFGYHHRSEERRVGTECRPRCSRPHATK